MSRTLSFRSVGAAFACQLLLFASFATTIVANDASEILTKAGVQGSLESYFAV